MRDGCVISFPSGIMAEKSYSVAQYAIVAVARQSTAWTSILRRAPIFFVSSKIAWTYRIPSSREAKGKKPYAVLVPVDDEETLEAIEDLIDARSAEKALGEMKRKGEKPIPYEQVRKELGLK